jgi:DNA polymerase III subunit delta'
MWRGILGHDQVVDQFRRTLESGRLASTYLFVGPPGVGKRQFAMELAHALLCTESPDAALEPCGQCDSCRLFAAGNHPDLEWVSLDRLKILVPKKADSSMLPVEVFIGDKERRNQEGLCHNISMKPFFGKRKIAIVEDADHFSIPSANCLLKTLEEPPPSALLILIGTSPARQLPTIRSRSQVVRFAPLDDQTVVRLLVDSGLVPDEAQASRAAELAEGSVERAAQLADPALGEFRELLLSELQSPMFDGVRLARSVQAFVDEAGKEPSLRRNRLRLVIDLAILHYRSVLRNGSATQSETIAQALDACLDSLEHIDRNANMAILIQSWCEQLVTAKAGHAARMQFSHA